MERRKAMKIAAGVFAGSGIGLYSLANLFEHKYQPDTEPYKLDHDQPENKWKYVSLSSDQSAELAYSYYSEGSCMYATVKGIIAQLAEKVGEPYVSFPLHMFKYGHGGIGGYGSVCGTLNGAAAVIGLIISDKSIQDRLIADLFQWYEKEPNPTFTPADPELDFTPVRDVPNSVLCHASATNWCNKSGYEIGSKERKERCRRLTANVAAKLTTVLNEVHSNDYTTNTYSNEIVGTCVSCHGNEGKLENVSGKMNCNSCHTESAGHRVFSDIHYKIMKK